MFRVREKCVTHYYNQKQAEDIRKLTTLPFSNSPFPRTFAFFQHDTTAIVACVSSVAIFSVIGAGYCFYKVQQSNKAAADVEFPSYGVIGPANRDDGKDGSTGGDGRGSASLVSASGAKCSSPPADRKLAQSAQMYHYHHQKQQMISNEK